MSKIESNKMKILWKDIPNYEKLYQISNTGEVRSLERYVEYKGVKYLQKMKILKKQIKSHGYYTVVLWKKGKGENFTIHRLVAENFLINEHNYPVVNHIDGNKLNNLASNLEWCSYGHNAKEAYRLGQKEPRIKKRKVAQYDKANNLITIWDSAKEAGETKMYDDSCIHKCCAGVAKTHKKYIWRYVYE